MHKDIANYNCKFTTAAIVYNFKYGIYVFKFAYLNHYFYICNIKIYP